MSKPNLDTMPPGGYNKDQVNYRQYEACKTCVHFNGRVYCNKVEGRVSADAVCNLWTLVESTVGLTNKQVITNEYEKSKGGI